MTQKTKFLFATALFGFSIAAPLQEREVPQEHSHESVLVSVRKSLAISNPLEIKDPVFGLLGDKAASEGAGKVTNLKCLQRKIADQAFTNAKAANDIPGMTNALTYAALERNTGAVGKASDTCDEPATNPEVNALKQHQDPASPGAQADNKAIVLELARQIASIGGDPNDAALSATFAPGKTNDPTAKGNSCDDTDDPKGCIFTKNLIQVEATPDEIKDAVKSGGSSSSSSASSDSSTNSKSNKKVVQKRNQVASTTNPEDRMKSTHKSKGFPGIIPRDSQPDFDNDNDKVKRDDDDNNGRGRNGGNRRNRNDNDNDKVKRDDDDNNGRGRNGGNRRNRNDNDNDKVKRDFDQPDFDFDNDNDKMKRDDDDNNGRGRNGGNRRNRNDNNDDKRKRDIEILKTRGVINSIKISEKKNNAAGSRNKKSNNQAAKQKRSYAKRASNTGNNVQTFTGSKGGPPPEVIETPGSTRPFTVAGDTFVGKKVALQRSCDKQHNSCANAANSGAGGSVAECEEQQKQCVAAASANTKRSVEKRSIFSLFSKRAAADLGSCSDPTVEFKEGFDGRKEASFKAVNQKDFNHGSTQKLKITSDFICQKLESSCKASQQIIDSCKSASQAAASLDGQAAADAFNKAFS